MWVPRHLVFLVLFLLFSVLQTPTSAISKVKFSFLFCLSLCFWTNYFHWRWYCYGIVLCSLLGVPFTWPSSFWGWFRPGGWLSSPVSCIILGKVCDFLYYIFTVLFPWAKSMFVGIVFWQPWEGQRCHLLLVPKAHQWFCCHPWRGTCCWNCKYDMLVSPLVLFLIGFNETLIIFSFQGIPVWSQFS